MSIYGSKGAMLGSGYEVGSKRPRMTESDPYFAVSGTAANYLPGYGSRTGFSGGAASPVPSAAAAFPFPAVKLRGLPFNCTELDVYRFFSGLDIVDCLLTHKAGRFSGESYVVFATPLHAELALQRDRLNMGRRYVEVFRCKKPDYYAAIAAELDCPRGTPPPREAKSAAVSSGVLKLRGLPFSATCADIADFFSDFDVAPENVHVAHRPDGRATGEAYVEFSSTAVAATAMLAKDRMTVGSRYVEIFPSSTDEIDRARSHSRP
ncbi:uncharacterized protein LOC144710125 [Wolffia australiana]